MFIGKHRETASQHAHYDAVSFRLGSAAEPNMPVPVDADVMTRPPPVFIRLRNLFVPKGRTLPSPKAPPNSPTLLPPPQQQGHFNLFHVMRQKLVEAASQRMAEFLEDIDRAKRYASSGITVKVRTHPVGTSPIFLGSQMGFMGLAEKYLQGQFFSVDELRDLPMVTYGIGPITDEKIWMPAPQQKRLIRALHDLEVHCAKHTALQDVRVSFSASGGAHRIRGISGAFYQIDSIWLHATLPDVHERFR